MNAINSKTEVQKYFNDIIRNKEIIKNMFLTNIEAYNSKVKQNTEIIDDNKIILNSEKRENEEKCKKIQDEINKLIEDQKKHEVNYKLLNKTVEHYQILIKDRHKDINTLKQKTIFVNQDTCNRKLQLDSLTVQIEEAEYQNKILNDALKKKNEELNISRYNEIQIEKLERENIIKDRIIVEDESRSSNDANTKIDKLDIDSSLIKDNHYMRNRYNTITEGSSEINIKKTKCSIF